MKEYDKKVMVNNFYQYMYQPNVELQRKTHTHTHTHIHTHTHRPSAHTRLRHIILASRKIQCRTYVQSVSYKKNIHIILTQRNTELQTVSVFSMKYSQWSLTLSIPVLPTCQYTHILIKHTIMTASDCGRKIEKTHAKSITLIDICIRV